MSSAYVSIAVPKILACLYAYRCVFGFVVVAVGTTTGPMTLLLGDLFPLLLLFDTDEDDVAFGDVFFVVLLVRELGILVTDPRREVTEVFTALGAVLDPLLEAPRGIGLLERVADDEVVLLLLLTCRTECSGWARDDSMGNVRRNCCHVTVSLSS